MLWFNLFLSIHLSIISYSQLNIYGLKDMRIVAKAENIITKFFPCLTYLTTLVKQQLNMLRILDFHGKIPSLCTKKILIF